MEVGSEFKPFLTSVDVAQVYKDDDSVEVSCYVRAGNITG